MRTFAILFLAAAWLGAWGSAFLPLLLIPLAYSTLGTLAFVRADEPLLRGAGMAAALLSNTVVLVSV